MHQAGALHLADVAGAFCPEAPASADTRPAATATLAEFAAAHEGLSLEAYVLMLYEALYGD